MWLMCVVVGWCFSREDEWCFGDGLGASVYKKKVHTRPNNSIWLVRILRLLQKCQSCTALDMCSISLWNTRFIVGNMCEYSVELIYGLSGLKNYKTRQHTHIKYTQIVARPHSIVFWQRHNQLKYTRFYMSLHIPFIESLYIWCVILIV